MIYRIKNEQDWRRFLAMMQTRYNPDVKAWTSIHEPGANSLEDGLGGMLEDLVEDSEDCVKIDYQELRDELNDLYWDMRQKLDEADCPEDTQNADEYDAGVVDVCMKHVRPRYPVLVSVIDMSVAGGREPWVEHPLFNLRMQSCASADEDPEGYQTRRWHDEGHCTVDEFVEGIRRRKWHVVRWKSGSIPLTGELPRNCYEVLDTETVLARILQDRDCFGPESRDCQGLATRLDITWSSFSGSSMADACWKSRDGTVHCYSFSEDKPDGRTA